MINRLDWNNMKKLVSLCLVALSMGLAGCGASEPSENDMFDALARFDTGQQMFGPRDKMSSDMKKVSCEKAGDKTFKCLIGSPDGTGLNFPFIFTKTDNGWMAAPSN